MIPSFSGKTKHFQRRPAWPTPTWPPMRGACRWSKPSTKTAEDDAHSCPGRTMPIDAASIRWGWFGDLMVDCPQLLVGGVEYEFYFSIYIISHHLKWLVLDDTLPFCKKNIRGRSSIIIQISTGWWFGIWILFFHILGIYILTPTEFHVFQRAWNHRPVYVSYCMLLLVYPREKRCRDI